MYTLCFLCIVYIKTQLLLENIGIHSIQSEYFNNTQRESICLSVCACVSFSFSLLLTVKVVHGPPEPLGRPALAAARVGGARYLELTHQLPVHNPENHKSCNCYDRDDEGGRVNMAGPLEDLSNGTKPSLWRTF